MNIPVTPFLIGWLASTDYVFYDYGLVPNGAKFYIYKEKHTKKQLDEAKAWIRHDHDVVSFTLIKGSPENKERLLEFNDFVLVKTDWYKNLFNQVLPETRCLVPAISARPQA